MNINTCMESRRKVLMNLFAAASVGCRHSTHSRTQQGKRAWGRRTASGHTHHHVHSCGKLCLTPGAHPGAP